MLHEYKTIIKSNSTELDEAASLCLNNGWKLHGNLLFVHRRDFYDSDRFIQVVVKTTPE